MFEIIKTMITTNINFYVRKSRPLTWTFVTRGLNLFYAHDGNKNVSDVFFLALQNGIAAHYEYAPFGAITYTSKNTPYTIDLIAANPFRFSSEFYDPELDLIYYNYRHYSPTLGRWLSRDPIEEQGGLNLYAFCKNKMGFDIMGLNPAICICGGVVIGEFSFALYAAATILGISVFACALDENCRRLAGKIACETACETEYRLSCSLCDVIYPFDRTQNKFCKKQAAEAYAQCLAD